MPVKPYYGLEAKACGSFEAWWNERELGDFEGMGLSWAPNSMDDTLNCLVDMRLIKQDGARIALTNTAAVILA